MNKETLKRAKRKYQRKLKIREITFYLHEEDLYNFSKSINFNKFVKEALTERLNLIKADENLERAKKSYGNRNL